MKAIKVLLIGIAAVVREVISEAGADEVSAALPEVVEAVGDRKDLVVVAQSFGAFTAPLVADRLPVDVLVLVAGMIPSPGESPGDWWRNTGYQESVQEQAARDGGLTGNDDPYVSFYHDVPRALAEEAIAWDLAHGGDYLAVGCQHHTTLIRLWRGELGAAAEYHSVDMAMNNYFGHYALDGTDAGTNIQNFGYTGFPYSENIAAGMATAQEVLIGWQNSPEHNATMTNPQYTEIGIGRHYNEASHYGWYWTATYGAGEGPQTAPEPLPAPVVLIA
jgi:hypothetical protein